MATDAIRCRDPSHSEVTTESESSRPLMRTVFDFECWRVHRDARRHQRHLWGTLRSRILKSLKWDLFGVVSLSTGVAVFENWKEHHPATTAGWLSTSLEASDPFQLTSFALSLLLAFRLDASYTRWADARAAWSSVVCDCRELMRQALSFMPGNPAARAMLGRYIIAFPRALMFHVREDCDLAAELEGVLERHEAEEMLRGDAHVPNLMLAVMSAVIHRSVASEANRVAMDERLAKFADVVATCERIIKTPIPRSYTRHTSRFLSIWLAIMPFDLWRACQWAMVPAAGIIAFLLLSIEEIGVQIEEPFSILPLENVVDMVEMNIRELLQASPRIDRLIHLGLSPSNGVPNRTPLQLANGTPYASGDGQRLLQEALPPESH